MPPRWYRRVKPALDFLLALVLLILTAPLLGLAALLVKLTSRGPAFYSQTRLGLDGRPFAIYKLRSMYEDCEKTSGARWSVRGDPRVTPIGWLLRVTHLDELPQLWNVLRGEMSLIGPRPERPEFVPRLERALPRYRERLRVRPGLTGLAQVQLPPDSDLDSVRRKLDHDLYYVARLGLWLDLRILFSTVLHVLKLPFSFTRLFVPGGAAVEQAYRRGRGPKGPTAPAARLERDTANDTHLPQPSPSSNGVEGRERGTTYDEPEPEPQHA
jgi:lipopolysaccharide/colanic/teichoic acid biosynthesis glycosyltransferase